MRAAHCSGRRGSRTDTPGMDPDLQRGAQTTRNLGGATPSQSAFQLYNQLVGMRYRALAKLEPNEEK